MRLVEKSSEELEGNAFALKDLREELRLPAFIKAGLVGHGDHLVFCAGSALIGQHVDAHERLRGMRAWRRIVS